MTLDAAFSQLIYNHGIGRELSLTVPQTGHIRDKFKRGTISCLEMWNLLCIGGWKHNKKDGWYAPEGFNFQKCHRGRPRKHNYQEAEEMIVCADSCLSKSVIKARKQRTGHPIHGIIAHVLKSSLSVALISRYTGITQMNIIKWRGVAELELRAENTYVSEMVRIMVKKLKENFKVYKSPNYPFD